jgi:superoxide reductase
MVFMNGFGRRRRRMTRLRQVWKCELCGNVVEVLHEGVDSLVCCEKAMVLKVDKIEEEGMTEKHVPVIEGNVVKVGSVAHPMVDGHYIEWVEGVGKDGEVMRKFFEVGDEARVEFCFDVVSARAYCNLHGLWVLG